MSQDEPFVRKSHGLDGPISWEDGVSGALQGRANSVCQDGVSAMAPISRLCGERAQKRDSGLCLPFCLGQSCPPAVVLMPDNSFPPHMPLVSFKLLPWCWSLEGVSLSKSVCEFFKGKCLGHWKFLPLTHSPLVFAARSYRDLSS